MIDPADIEAATERVRLKLATAILGTAMGDKEARETLYHTAQALDALKAELIAAAAAQQIEQYVADQAETALEAD